MSIFTDLLSVWRKEDLLSQAWDESLQMLDLSHVMFYKAVKKSKKQENLSVLKTLKNRDKEINSFHREVRRKIITHYSLEQSKHDVTSLMVLVNMIVDIERIGDYSKNILDLAINYTDALNTKHLHKDLYDIENAVNERFDLTIDAVKTQDVIIARKLLKGFKEKVTGASDRIVNNIIGTPANRQKEVANAIDQKPFVFNASLVLIPSILFSSLLTSDFATPSIG